MGEWVDLGVWGGGFHPYGSDCEVDPSALLVFLTGGTIRMFVAAPAAHLSLMPTTYFFFLFFYFFNAKISPRFKHRSLVFSLTLNYVIVIVGRVRLKPQSLQFLRIRDQDVFCSHSPML